MCRMFRCPRTASYHGIRTRTQRTTISPLIPALEWLSREIARRSPPRPGGWSGGVRITARTYSSYNYLGSVPLTGTVTYSGTTLTANVADAPDGATLAYQWQVEDDGEWTNIRGATNPCFLTPLKPRWKLQRGLFADHFCRLIGHFRIN